MGLKLLSKRKDGNIVMRCYSCPCGKGTIEKSRIIRRATETHLFPLDVKNEENTIQSCSDQVAQDGKCITITQLITKYKTFQIQEVRK